MNGNKFATSQILQKPVEVVKGRILAGGAQKSPKPCPRHGAADLESIDTLQVLHGAMQLGRSFEDDR